MGDQRYIQDSDEEDRADTSPIKPHGRVAGLPNASQLEVIQLSGEPSTGSTGTHLISLSHAL